eukprot:TRINITY_DN37225_c0_g1_i1.p1 TRINITY_DN37225_c0_g1~~TRINITY_DN37225_c0_g1_i1.p1  ORF type:complete len:240 (+),score=12.01 TRINITY_DN37225_c0_g1_i1:340-1059(+)
MKACAEVELEFPDAHFSLVHRRTRRLVETMLQRCADHRPSATKAIRVLERCAALAMAEQSENADSPSARNLQDSLQHVSRGTVGNACSVFPGEVGRSDVCLVVPHTPHTSSADHPVVDLIATSRESLSQECAGPASEVDLAAISAGRWPRPFYHKVNTFAHSVSHYFRKKSRSGNAHQNGDISPSGDGSGRKRNEHTCTSVLRSKGFGSYVLRRLRSQSSARVASSQGDSRPNFDNLLC